jgi:hypothetical protein
VTWIVFGLHALSGCGGGSCGRRQRPILFQLQTREHGAAALEHVRHWRLLDQFTHDLVAPLQLG